MRKKFTCALEKFKRFEIIHILIMDIHSPDAEMLMRFLGTLGSSGGIGANFILTHIKPPLKSDIISAEQILTEIAIRTKILDFSGNQWTKYSFSLRVKGDAFRAWFRNWFKKDFEEVEDPWGKRAYKKYRKKKS